MFRPMALALCLSFAQITAKVALRQVSVIHAQLVTKFRPMALALSLATTKIALTLTVPLTAPVVARMYRTPTTD